MKQSMLRNRLHLRHCNLLLLRNLSNSFEKVKLSPTDLKLNLPNAGDFQLSMKNICQTEEKIKKLADFDGLYKWQQENRQTSPVFTLQDGPPYANGDIHIGHMVNKVLKDIYLRYKLISGYRIQYTPGWDCHGLPIEINALKSIGKQKQTDTSKKNLSLNKANPIELRKLASKYSEQFINVQRESFRRMNLLCDWSNIYRTIDPDYMCNELDLFHKLYEKKLIYRDYMPVYWSVSSQTALAESELEYNLEHKSDALYVAFEIVEFSPEIKKFLKPDQRLFAPIWTTTPWSLPCNKAIAYNPNLKYGLLSVNEKVYIIQTDLISTLQENLPYFQNSTRIENALLESVHFENSKYTSPFLSGTSILQKIIPSDHVGSKQGTGLVHIAPALGHDDFKIGLKHNLENRCVIDEQGKYTDDDEILKRFELEKMLVLNESTTAKIKKILGDTILHENKHQHSYPYDWRTKKPCIIRSSMQWFIDTNQLKDPSLQALANVRVRPSNVTNSMLTTIASRPYWCISRQRSWGLPIPCIYDRNDVNQKNPIINKEFLALMKDLIKKEGTVDFWWSGKYDAELKKAISKSSTDINNEKMVKSSDIFDIWFDSGSAFTNSLFSTPADLYCEGIDQFSGWFQSSLLLSIGLRRQSPYKSLLVHGFVVDESNRKMSKSVGNVIDPIHAIEGQSSKKIPQAGLDTMRFWIAHEYHKAHIQIGGTILEKFLKRAFEVRSIVRFVTANLSDFDVSRSIKYEDLCALDKYELAKLVQITDTVRSCYDDMSINKALNSLETYLLTNLSSYYFKCIKDRLYCEPRQSHKRLSAQTTLHHILINTLILIAPIMPHLAEEAFHYSHLNKLNPSGLFRSNLNLTCDPIWSNSKVEGLFEIVNQMRDKLNENIGSENPALHFVELECDKDGFELMMGNTGSDFSWLVEIFGCAKINVKLSEEICLLSATDKNCKNIKYNMKVSKIDQTKIFSCNRCRRFASEKKDEFCERCKSVMSSQL